MKEEIRSLTDVNSTPTPSGDLFQSGTNATFIESLWTKKYCCILREIFNPQE